MKPLNHLTAIEAAKAIEAGELTAESLARACLERIAARNEAVRAFVAHDPQRILAEARRVDLMADRPILRGIPFAVKDVFDTIDYPTSFGSPIHARNRPTVDAACVAGARENGAVLFGKVATGEFATQSPSATRNPLRLSHTPGGSSSGPAAAVADRMVPVAFGTQTTGSIVRPATYCGVIGYKPTFDLLPRAGMKALSPSQDTAGLLSRTVADAAFFAHGVHGARALLEAPPTPRIAVCESAQWEHAKPQTTREIERFVSRLERAGASVRRIRLDARFEALVDTQSALVAYEGRRSLAHEYRFHREQLSERLRTRLESSRSTSLDDYQAMLRKAADARHRSASLFDDVDVLLYPSAEGEAEAGIEYSGSPRFGALWTLLHLPTVAFPIAVGDNGLPLGVQVIGAYMEDQTVLAAAQFAVAAADFLQGSEASDL